MSLRAFLVLLAALGGAVPAHSGGGPFGIDSVVSAEATGIWSRGNQKAVKATVAGAVVVGALWEGADTRFGRTLWQSADALVVGEAGYAILNATFRRLRPSQSPDPDQWFKPGGHSFPSNDVTIVAAAITPLVLEYGRDNPAVYALELLPLYMAIGRVRSHAHWQSDVLAGWALGTAAGWYAHSRAVPITVTVLPRGFSIGWRTRF